MARRDRPSRRDEEILSPEELDIAADENVAALGGGRFVVGPDGPPNEEKVEEIRAELADAHAESAETDDSSASKSNESPETGTGREIDRSETDDSSEHSPTGREVKAWINHQLHSSNSRYAYRIAAKSGDHVSHQQLASDDVATAFDSLLSWYAQQVGHGTAVENALGILLAESSIRAKYPTRRLIAYLDEHDLDPDDSISELVSTVHTEGGLVFPPRRRKHE